MHPKSILYKEAQDTDNDSSPLFPQLKFIVKWMGIVYIKRLERKGVPIKSTLCAHIVYFFSSKSGVLMGEITHWKQTRWFLVIHPNDCEKTFQNGSVYK